MLPSGLNQTSPSGLHDQLLFATQISCAMRAVAMCALGLSANKRTKGQVLGVVTNDLIDDGIKNK